MKKYIICCLLILGLCANGFCGQLSKIELIDGSVIEGEVVSLNNGIYTIRTTKGVVEIYMLKIRSITTGNAPSLTVDRPKATLNPVAAPSNEAIKAEMDQIKSKMVSNPDIMQTVAAIAEDPQFQELVKDPQIAELLKAQDVKALMANEKFMNVINNPKIKEIQSKLNEPGK